MAFLAHGARCGMLDVFSDSDPVVNFDGTPTINRPMTFQVNGEFQFYTVKLTALNLKKHNLPLFHAQFRIFRASKTSN